MEFEYSLANIKESATRLWNQFGDRKVFAFHGDLGAGKTTFVHALCEVLGVEDVVSSPSFSIINEYRHAEGGESSIIHIDLYRLKNSEEARGAGVEDCLYSGQICFVEWPERAPELFPEHTVNLYFHVLDASRRRLKINGN